MKFIPINKEEVRYLFKGKLNENEASKIFKLENQDCDQFWKEFIYPIRKQFFSGIGYPLNWNSTKNYLGETTKNLETKISYSFDDWCYIVNYPQILKISWGLFLKYWNFYDYSTDFDTYIIFPGKEIMIVNPYWADIFLTEKTVFFQIPLYHQLQTNDSFIVEEERQIACLLDELHISLQQKWDDSVISGYFVENGYITRIILPEELKIPQRLCSLNNLIQFDNHCLSILFKTIPNQERQALLELFHKFSPKNIYADISEGHVNQLYLSGKSMEITKKNQQYLQFIQDFTFLERLCIIYYIIINIPIEIFRLQNLKELNLSANYISNIPSEITNCRNLKRIDLSANDFNQFPIIFKDLNQLEFIDLSDMERIESISGIQNCPNLTHLILNRCNIIELTSEIGKLTKLQLLDVGMNINMNTFPKEIGKLTNLKIILANDSGLEVIPSELGDLKNIEKLGFYRTKIKNLPNNIGNLINLTELDIRETFVDKLPSSFFQLPKLIHCMHSINDESLTDQIDNLILKNRGLI